MKQRILDYGWGIFRLWINWLEGSGAITLLVILSLWVKPLFLPFIAFGFMALLFYRIRRNRELRIPSCYILPFVVTRVLFWTGLVMIMVNFLYNTSLAERLFDMSKINRDIPFICVLITSPIATIIAGITYLHRHHGSFCRDCQRRNGTPAERGFLGMIYTQVGMHQVGMLLWISAVPTVVGWSYYALLYVNTDLSLPDKFVFFIIPLLLWIFAAIYLGVRYIAIWGYYKQNIEGSLERHGAYTLVRCIVIWDNYIGVCPPETDTDKRISLDDKSDTPLSIYIRRVEKLTQQQAEQYFSNYSGVSNPDIRFMYANLVGNADCNILHYLCFLDDAQKEQLEKRFPTCRWLTLNEMATMINTHRLAPLMSAEVIRLHTIAMAWKTYDSKGHRRYKIKNYRPTFRICGIHSWDIDYDDPHWLYISDNNQDTPFHALRYFWRKYINGVGS